MIIQCDHCSARFKMDDSKLANGPVKVRCAKCKEVFVVHPEEPAAETVPSPSPEVPPFAGGESVTQGASEPQEEPGSGDTGFSFETAPSVSDSSPKEDNDFSFDFETPSVGTSAGAAGGASPDNFDWKEKEPDAGSDSSEF